MPIRLCGPCRGLRLMLLCKEQGRETEGITLWACAGRCPISSLAVCDKHAIFIILGPQSFSLYTAWLWFLLNSPNVAPFFHLLASVPAVLCHCLPQNPPQCCPQRWEVSGRFPDFLGYRPSVSLKASWVPCLGAGCCCGCFTYFYVPQNSSDSACWALF